MQANKYLQYWCCKNGSDHRFLYVNFGGFLGAALAPVITGIILDATGQFTNVFILGGCLLFLGVCLYGFFVRKPLAQ